MEIIVDDLNDFERLIIDQILLSINDAVEEILSNPSLDDVFLLTKTIALVCGKLEAVRISGDKRLRGHQKKKIAYYIGKCVLKNSSLKHIFERSGEDMIEVLIDFAKSHKVIARCTNFCI